MKMKMKMKVICECSEFECRKIIVEVVKVEKLKFQ